MTRPAPRTRSSHIVNATMATLAILFLLVALTTAVVHLVREFHERPVQVYYCDKHGCGEGA